MLCSPNSYDEFLKGHDPLLFLAQKKMKNRRNIAELSSYQ